MDIRFHLDENIHGGVARGLSRRGIDVTTSKETGLLGASDQTNLNLPARQGEFSSLTMRIISQPLRAVCITAALPIGMPKSAQWATWSMRWLSCGVRKRRRK
jgi:hypothetical protein